MELKTQIHNLQNIASELRKDSRIEGVYLEYPAYLSVITNEAKEQGVYFGYEVGSDEEVNPALFTWNSIEDGHATFPDGRTTFGEFPTDDDPELVALVLIKQLTQKGYLND